MLSSGAEARIESNVGVLGPVALRFMGLLRPIWHDANVPCSMGDEKQGNPQAWLETMLGCNPFACHGPQGFL